ncbi:Swt1 family HEPN domain-containing protein [Roseococcus microcysteis]|uniref:Swt1 family HEPN domain-containing protein n=1 Tax=Roseococcus microcysteis TaxID=2771361 RepID=UPI00168B6427|nr:Swt1 family HEPN domain-containing protein [Roseococcus microcysteis]
MKDLHAIKLFGLNNLAIESEIRRLERELSINLGHHNIVKKEDESSYFPQFDYDIRKEAAEMAAHYQIFYCLENFIRKLVVERLKETHGPDWWVKAVPENVRNNAQINHKKELSSGMTLRSSDLIDYTTFGELGEIIKSNWDLFGESFRDLGAVQRILYNLNLLRAPIAHCKLLAEDEVLRLRLSLRDWFRQMS